MQRIRIMSFSYAVSAFMDASLAASRGIGKTIVPTIIIILGSCVFRIVWVYTVFVYFHTIPGLYLLYFFSWVITAIAEIIYFAVSYLETYHPVAAFLFSASISCHKLLNYYIFQNLIVFYCFY